MLILRDSEVERLANSTRRMATKVTALKEENERLKAEKVQINGKLAGSRLAVSRLEARVADLERALALMLKVHDLSDSPDGDVTRIARAALKEQANEG